ncbi:MAG: alpha/beta hydrolase [Ethanoligenens sp.]
MAINKFMRAALKAISYNDIDVRNNYKVDRFLNTLTHLAFKPLYKTWDAQIKVDGYPLTVRSFSPKCRRSDEIILFFHGGGWVTGNIGNYTRTCAVLSNQTGRRVLSLNYRLAPEFPFPCAVQDCYQVAKRLFVEHLPLEVSDKEIILMGDSAGGNLAAVVSLMAAERGEFHVGRQILLYPLTYNDHSESSPFPSVQENGKDYLLTSKRLCDYSALYIRDQQDKDSPYFAPLLSDHLIGQPHTLIVTAEFDPLRDEGEAYGEKLRQFGNEAQIYRMKDALHGFISLPPCFAQVKRCYQYINAFLDGKGAYAEQLG